MILLLACVLTAATQAPATYGRAIDAFQSGGIDAAVPVLASLSRKDIEEGAQILTKSETPDAPGPERRRFEAAALMHTEYAVASDLDERDVALHIDVAHLLLSFDRWSWEHRDRMTARSGVEIMSDAQMRRNAEHAHEFLPPWYSVASSVLLTRDMDLQAQKLVAEGLKMWPTDPLLLFRDGVIKEFNAVWHPTLPHDPNHLLAEALRDTGSASFDPSFPRRNWEPAESAYRKAISRNADNAEIHLHLGYVLSKLGEADAAQDELVFARDHSQDGFVVYLADLFLGRLSESRNDLRGAAEHYERARSVGGSCQTALIALSSVYFRAGNRARARALIASLTSVPDAQRTPDPWWTYHTNRISVEELAALRRLIQE
jgi:tetratricopeptide (TPR) repeat protein